MSSFKMIATTSFKKSPPQAIIAALVDLVNRGGEIVVGSKGRVVVQHSCRCDEHIATIDAELYQEIHSTFVVAASIHLKALTHEKFVALCVKYAGRRYFPFQLALAVAAGLRDEKECFELAIAPTEEFAALFYLIVNEKYSFNQACGEVHYGRVDDIMSRLSRFPRAVLMMVA